MSAPGQENPSLSPPETVMDYQDHIVVRNLDN